MTLSARTTPSASGERKTICKLVGMLSREKATHWFKMSCFTPSAIQGNSAGLGLQDLSCVSLRKERAWVATGTGKTAIMRDKLRNMDAEITCSSTINMNSFSDAPTLQPILEQPLEKKSGEQLLVPCKFMELDSTSRIARLPSGHEQRQACYS